MPLYNFVVFMLYNTLLLLLLLSYQNYTCPLIHAFFVIFESLLFWQSWAIF